MGHSWHSLRGMALLLIIVGCSSPSPPDINFITQRRSGVGMDALLEGKLTLKEACLYINHDGSNYAAVWPYSYSSSKDGEGVTILNAERQVVAQVGDTIRVGGGAVPHPTDEVFAQNYIADAQCSGNYWIVNGDVEVIAP